MVAEYKQDDNYLVLEVSNEIANKIGGIYTVIASKAPDMLQLLGEGNYYTIGLFNAFKARADFEELPLPDYFSKTLSQVKKQGITVKFGRWKGGGGVKTFLVDPSHLLDFPVVTGKTERKIDQIKGVLWDWFNIDSLWMSEVFDPMVAFGWATGILIKTLMESSPFQQRDVVTLFHEWISAPGLLFLVKRQVNVAKIFMTHATQLGRNIAMGEEDINKVIDRYLSQNETIPPQKAYQYHVEGTHQLEVECAKHADLLITVSKAVARETKCILGRKADIIIPNGINLNTIAPKEKLQQKQQTARKRINQFIEDYFYPFYYLNTENLHIINISGRYEFHNKGIDVFLQSLKMVNESLNAQKVNTRTIVAFIWIPTAVSGIKEETTLTMEISEQKRTILKNAKVKISKNFEKQFRKNREYLTYKEVEYYFTPKQLRKLQALEERMVKIGTEETPNPPITPFKINKRDTIFQTLKQMGLENKETDSVKVIFYPIYLSKKDKLLALDYYDAVAGCNLGVYPSIYEPFGLTPLEALALGVPAITTDLAGFGMYVSERTSEEALGIHVLQRRNKTDYEAAQKLAEVILRHSQLPRKKLSKARMIAREIAELYSWENIITKYLDAFQKALEKK